MQAWRPRAQRQHRTSDGGGRRVALECGRERSEPSRAGRAVIVGDCQHGAGRRREGEIARRGGAETRLFEVSRSLNPALLHDAPRLGRRRLVDDDRLARKHGARRERRQAAG